MFALNKFLNLLLQTVLLVTFFSPAYGMERRRDEFAEILLEESGARGVLLDPVPAFASIEGLTGDGGHLAGEDLPAEIEILGIGPDYLLALYDDPMEVEYVRLYELTRPG